MNWGWVTGILASTIRQSTPCCSSLSELFYQSSGIMNIWQAKVSCYFQDLSPPCDFYYRTFGQA